MLHSQRSPRLSRSPLLGTGEEESGLRPYTLHRCWPLATILTIISLTLLIVSAAQPSVYSTTVASPSAWPLCLSAPSSCATAPVR